MTPADCKPGTVVVWGTYVGVIEERSLIEAAAILNGVIEPGEYIGVRSDAGHHLVEPYALQLAPRFLVGGEWRVERCEPLQGAIDWMRGAWTWSVPVRPGVHHSETAPTYHAARQAVERACGIETAKQGESNGNES